MSSANWLLLECFKDNLSKCHQRMLQRLSVTYLNDFKQVSSANWLLLECFKQASVISELTTTWMLQRQFKQVSSANWLLLKCEDLSKCHQRTDNYLILQRLKQRLQFKQVSSANWQVSSLLECCKDNLSKCHQRTDYYLNASKTI